MGVFGRSKDQQVAAQPVAPTTTTGTGGKGRPTPRRREAEKRNHRPVVGAPKVNPNASKEERKAARAARRQAMALERAQARTALQTGEERFLPPRDKGPVRRWARDVVDARRSPGEYLMPVAIVMLLIGMFRGIPYAVIGSTLFLYAMVLVVIVDSVLLGRRVKRDAAAKFGADKISGVGFYAVMRSLQLRRLRLPRPQVERGQTPA